MNIEKIKSTYIRVAGLTMTQREKLISLIDASSLRIHINSRTATLNPHDINDFEYLYYDCADVNRPKFVRFRVVLREQSHLSIVTFEEYDSYFSLGVELQHNKTKFIVV